MVLLEKTVISGGPNHIEELIRVPGGWIYYKGTMQGDTSCFIPFNNEFQ